MLDAFIIQRIRKSRDLSEGLGDSAGGDSGGRIPLRIEIPIPPEMPVQRPAPPEESERGVVEIDFNI